MIKYVIIFLLNFIFFYSSTYGQGGFRETKEFRFFNRTELSYTFGLNETFLTNKLNSFQIKTVFGKQNENIGAGIGIATGSFRNAGGKGGGNFNTISFTGNLHYVFNGFSEQNNNFFIKGGIGYAPRIFAGYDKGLTYDGALGYIIRTKKGGRYFVEAIYHHQDFENFRALNTIAKVESVGIGIGTWF